MAATIEHNVAMPDFNTSHRRWFMHPAHQTTGAMLRPAGLPYHDSSEHAVAEEERPPRVRLVRGVERDLDDSLAWLQAYLETYHHIRSSQEFAQTEDEFLRLANLEDVDCLLLLAWRTKIGNEMFADNEPFAGNESFGSARGIVAIHPAASSLDSPILDTNDGSRYPNEPGEANLVETAKGHPVLAGVEPFPLHGPCSSPAVADDAQILLTGGFPGCQVPVAWLQVCDAGRIFRTSLGHPADFRQRSFLRLLGNAVVWASGR